MLVNIPYMEHMGYVPCEEEPNIRGIGVSTYSNFRAASAEGMQCKTNKLFDSFVKLGEAKPSHWNILNGG